MLWRLRRQGQNAGMAGSIVDTLIEDRAGQAVWDARKRAWEADTEFKGRYWARVASMVLFHRRFRRGELNNLRTSR
jgi:hypothetical protein